MTPEEIKALIAKAVSEQMAVGLKTGLDSFQAHFSEQFTPLADQLKAIEEALTAPGADSDDTPPESNTPPEDMSDPGTKALLERLARMEAKEAEREASASKERFSRALREAISPENPLHSTIVEELLTNRLSGLVETEGSYYNAKGEKLSELVSGFFASPEGQHFKPAKTKQGLGEPNTAGTTPQVPKAEPTLDDMLADMAL